MTTLDAICNVKVTIASANSQDEIIARTVEAIGNVVSFDACEFLLKETNTFVSRANTGLNNEQSIETTPESSVAEYVYQSQESLLINNTAVDDQFNIETTYRSLLTVSVGTHGVIQVADRKPDAFDEQDCVLLELMGNHVTTLLENLSADSQPTELESQLAFTPGLTEQVLEVADVMIVVLDADGRITLANRKAREILGYEKGELRGQDWFETCLPARHQAETREVFDQLMAGEVDSVARNENSVITNDGEERIIEWHNTLLRNTENEIIGTLSSGLDITAKKETEQQLQEEREKYTTLVENSNDGITIIQDGEFKFANERFAEFHDTTKENLIGKSFLTYINPEYHERAQERYEQRIAGENIPTRYEIEILDGKRTLEINAARIEYGDQPAVMGIVRDITERKRRERELEKSKRRYQTLVEQFPNGLVALFDEDHRHQLVGGKGFEELEITPGDLEDRRLDDVFPAANVESIKPLYEQALDGESNTVEVTLEDHIFRIHVVPVRDEEGNVFAGMTMSQDITDEKAHEQELEEAKKRYQTLLQAAPDPIFVADVETGEIIETNTAAEQFRDQPREEIIGLNQTDLHPGDDADRYRELFEHHVEEGGTRRRLPDGSPIYAVTATDEQIPVEISVETVELSEQSVIYGIFRDITDQLQYERALTGLNEVSRDLFKATSYNEIGQHIVETVTDILDLAGAVFYRFNETEGVLEPVTHSPSSEIKKLLGDLPILKPNESIAWRVFTDGETAVFDDVRTDPDVYSPKTPIRSEIIVPLGDYGIIIVGDKQSAAFDEQAVDLVEILGATATAALEQVEREQELRYRERQLTQRTQQLEEVESINTQIRNVTRTIVQADTRQEVLQAVCTELVEADSVEFAWIGTVDPVDNALVSQAQAGDDWGYLDDISTSLADTSGSEPAVQAAQTQENVIVSNTATDMTQETWRKEAVKRDFKSVMSIPLLHQETLQGVLTIYAESQTAFSGLVESVLSELGDLLAHGIVAIGRRQALLSNQGTELDFRIQDPACLFLRFAQETDSSLSVEGIIPQPDESSLVFVRVDGDVEQFIETAEQTPAVKTARLIETDGSALIQLRFVRPFIASILADQGITVHDITAEGSDCRVTVSVPPTFDIRQTVKTITTQYSDSELLAKREQSHPSGIAGNLTNRVLDELTPRQREVVEVAYFRGFFDSPREATGKEIAEELDISSTAFHQHVRSAEQKLFRAIFENGMSSSSGSTGNPLFG